jgi:hypothetical protein
MLVAPCGGGPATLSHHFHGRRRSRLDPIVAGRGWSIITRDPRISRRPAEQEAVRQVGAKVFALDGAEATNLWSQLEIVMTRWRDIERASVNPGPFIYSVTRSRIRPLL